jgi:hypothetical protein
MDAKQCTLPKEKLIEKHLHLFAYSNGTGRVVFFASSKSSFVGTKRSIHENADAEEKTGKNCTVKNFTWSSSQNVKGLQNGFSYANLVSQVQLRLSCCKLTRMCTQRKKRNGIC